MKKGIFNIAQESRVTLSNEQLHIENLKKENRLLKRQVTRQKRNIATEGFFDLFKSKSVATKHAPVTEEKLKTASEGLNEDHQTLRDVRTFTDVGAKQLEGNKLIYLSSFPSIQDLKTHFTDLLHIVDFVQTTCENTVKAHAIMHHAANGYSETGDNDAFFKEHKKYLKMTEPPNISGFKNESVGLKTNDLFQSLVFTRDVLMSRDKSWIIDLQGVDTVSDKIAKEAIGYDFPMLSYVERIRHFTPQPRSEDLTMTISKADLVNLHGILDKACTRTLGLLAKYDYGHNPIETYINEFSKEMINKGKARISDFYTNSYYRAEDNYHSGRYHFGLLDLTEYLGAYVEYFNNFVFMYEPDPEDGAHLK